MVLAMYRTGYQSKGRLPRILILAGTLLICTPLAFASEHQFTDAEELLLRAVTIQDGVTTGLLKVVTIMPTGDVTYQGQQRPRLPLRIVQRLYADVDAAGPLSKLPVKSCNELPTHIRCISMASQRSSYHLNCPNQTDQRVLALNADIDQVLSVLGPPPPKQQPFYETPVLPSGMVQITMGATNGRKINATILPDGTVTQYGRVSPQKLPTALVSRFYVDLNKAMPLSRLPVVGCVKSTSFGSRCFIRFGTEISPDLDCPNQTDSRVIALTKDINEIMQFIHAAKRNELKSKPFIRF